MSIFRRPSGISGRPYGACPDPASERPVSSLITFTFQPQPTGIPKNPKRIQPAKTFPVPVLTPQMTLGGSTSEGYTYLPRVSMQTFNPCEDPGEGIQAPVGHNQDNRFPLQVMLAAKGAGRLRAACKAGLRLHSWRAGAGLLYLLNGFAAILPTRAMPAFHPAFAPDTQAGCCIFTGPPPLLREFPALCRLASAPRGGSCFPRQRSICTHPQSQQVRRMASGSARAFHFPRPVHSSDGARPLSAERFRTSLPGPCAGGARL